MSMRMRFLPTFVLCVIAGVLAAAAGASLGPEPLPGATISASKQERLAKSPLLWATINKCDTRRAPNTIGIRASMPGLGGRRPATLSVRFVIQFKTTDGWADADRTADSGWRRVGRTREKLVETGQDFKIKPPSAGGAHTLRGLVAFRWKQGGRVVKQLAETTETGHRSSAGADPAGYSASICDISAP